MFNIFRKNADKKVRNDIQTGLAGIDNLISEQTKALDKSLEVMKTTQEMLNTILKYQADFEPKSTVVIVEQKVHEIEEMMRS